MFFIFGSDCFVDWGFVGRRAAVRLDRAPRPRAALTVRSSDATAAVREAASTEARVHAAPQPPSSLGVGARVGVRGGRAAQGSPQKESGTGERRPHRNGKAASPATPWRTQGARPRPVSSGVTGATPKIFLWRRKNTRRRKNRRRDKIATSWKGSRPGAESVQRDAAATASSHATFRTQLHRLFSFGLRLN